jgi:hypothetical protein
MVTNYPQSFICEDSTFRLHNMQLFRAIFKDWEKFKGSNPPSPPPTESLVFSHTSFFKFILVY